MINADRAKQIAIRDGIIFKKREEEKELFWIESTILDAARNGCFRIDYFFHTKDKVVQEAVILDLNENGYTVEMKEQFTPVESIKIMWGE